MFIEIITRKNENVLININHILFIATDKNGTVIYDIDGNEYDTAEPFDDIRLRLKKLENSK